MKRLSIHKILLLIPCILFGTIGIVCAQPATVVPEGSSLYQHGTNAGGTNAQENTDSVTINSTTKYYILPSANVNPAFNSATSLFNNVISTFSWSVTPALASGGVAAVAAYPLAPHYKQIAWTAAGTGNIQTSETANASQGSCLSANVVTPVEVITAPDVTAVTIANATCQTTPISVTCPNATLTISCVVKGSKGVKVTYSIDGPAGFADIVNAGPVTLGNSTTLNLSAITLNQPGAYILTINTVTDRIATKCGLTGIAETASATFYVTPTPRTGTNRHITNLGW